MPLQPTPAPISPDHAARRLGAFTGFGLAGVPGSRSVSGSWAIGNDDPDPIASIERILADQHQHGCAWAIMLGYELGGAIEPKARSAITDPQGFPLAIVQRLGERTDTAGARGVFEVGPLRSNMGRDGYTMAVRRALDYIAAGDVYQVNIAHHLTCPFVGSVDACASALIRAACPRYGAMMRFEHRGTVHSVCSLSPELFIRLDRASGVIRTQPMKGTRPIGGDEQELAHSPKDRAELNMITDLMRNDIGRVCRAGSVRVLDPRRIESHGSGVLQASSIVEGVVRDSAGVGELIRATFPPGSVTGAPKVRAMQIIDELEQQPRRSYCGSLLHIDAAGNIEASVAIRTAHIWGVRDPSCPADTDFIIDGHFEYPVGAGIVADSIPESEWEETLVKAGVLRSALGLDVNDLG